MALTPTEKDDGIGMAIAKKVATYSQCHSRRIGAVLMVHGRVIGWGCNGAMVMHPCRDCNRRELKSGERLDLCHAIHAEVNAICDAAKSGLQTLGATMYVTCGVPCKDCLNAIKAAGITRIVCRNAREFYDEMSRKMVTHSDLRVETYVQKINKEVGSPNWLDIPEEEEDA